MSLIPITRFLYYIVLQSRVQRVVLGIRSRYCQALPIPFLTTGNQDKLTNDNILFQKIGVIFRAADTAGSACCIIIRRLEWPSVHGGQKEVPDIHE
jgi:hypothetical protein